MLQKNLNDHLAPPRMLLRTPKGCEHPWLGTPGLLVAVSFLHLLMWSKVAYIDYPAKAWLLFSSFNCCYIKIANYL